MPPQKAQSFFGVLVDLLKRPLKKKRRSGGELSRIGVELKAGEACRAEEAVAQAPSVIPSDRAARRGSRGNRDARSSRYEMKRAKTTRVV